MKNIIKIVSVLMIAPSSILTAEQQPLRDEAQLHGIVANVSADGFESPVVFPGPIGDFYWQPPPEGE